MKKIIYQEKDNLLIVKDFLKQFFLANYKKDDATYE